MISGLPETGTLSSYSFTSPIGEQITQKIDHYYYVNGEVSIAGDPKISGSDFILKGNSEYIYGWVLLREKNFAYEYVTDDDGFVYVEQVAINKIYPLCPLSDKQEDGVQRHIPEDLSHLNKDAPEDHVKPWNNQDLYKLQSLPGSKYVLFMKIDAVMNGDTPKHHSKEKMYQAWQILASAYSVFDLNVTTDPDVHQAAGQLNSLINHLDNSAARPFCCIGCFGTGRKCSTKLSSNNLDYPTIYGRTISHESGHGMGLQHDGSSSGVHYFSGFSAYQWIPHMGSFFSGRTWEQALPQFSKGEYSGANQKQDDLAVMLSNPYGYRPDDIPGTQALKIGSGGQVDPAANRGQINGLPNNIKDSDTFTFTLGSAGHINISIDRTEPNHGSALDVDASIFDASGRLVAQDNKTSIRKAVFDMDLPAGSYRLVINGGAEGTPLNGFSNYSTFGFYAISGSITGSLGIKLDLKRFVSVSQGKDARINLDLPDKSKLENIALVSTNGAVVFHSPTKTYSIDISNLKAGIYVLKMKIDGAPWQRKILKN